jgi:hypothetical protein
VCLQELRSALDARSQEQNQQKIKTDQERKFQEKNAAQLVSAYTACCCGLLNAANQALHPFPLVLPS